MGAERKTKYPEPIGSGGLWSRSKVGKPTYFSGYLEFAKDMIPIRVNFQAFPVAVKSEDGPELKIRVLSWDFAPARRLDLERQAPQLYVKR